MHELILTNKSLSDHSAREKLFQLLTELADVVDPTSGADLQVANIRIELNAAAGSLDQVGGKASLAGATWEIFEEDF